MEKKENSVKIGTVLTAAALTAALALSLIRLAARTRKTSDDAVEVFSQGNAESYNAPKYNDTFYELFER